MSVYTYTLNRLNIHLKNSKQSQTDSEKRQRMNEKIWRIRRELENEKTQKRIIQKIKKKADQKRYAVRTNT